MRHFYFLSIAIFMLLSSLAPTTNSYFMMQQQGDMINSTCQQCADVSTVFDYDLCVTSLQAVPISHHVNLPGLAIVAMELDLANATSTVRTIERLIASKKFDPFVVDCLRDCLERYANAVSKVVLAIGAFLSDHYGAANMFLSAVVEESMSCEAEFRQKKGEPTPLVKENYYMFELSIIGLCIINLVTMDPSLSF
ncbi:unnamed protein product [Coffea canephora]|uniref:Pectinesterase inhibitor domain-containing protein n=2 Tax=Coffea TaxID=13442 RepID=A0A068UYL6_COFCA|nr:putative invertase inhibitor [Coffea arabica]CDP13407.1 unnamed protein product [Coffea canephora]